ncbi:MAG: PilZ domain-containing protein [Candidatus Omnitrophica bacterium]|nr:PilZ domain-containing protein [Candidatus Omnitrophota bacterium]MDD5771640.1 PilZ domain-containing protein [Candidatus Omnitrophota bacterium]
MGLLDFFREEEEKFDFRGSNKRLAPRWTVAVPAKIKFAGNSGYSPCEVRDLNLKGFSLFVSKKILKKRLPVRLYFSEKYSFKVEITILWSKPGNGKYLYGVKFSKIIDSDRERLLNMMNEDFPPHVWKGV